MEVPVQMALDTTENWNRSDVALLDSELGIEVYTDANKVEHRYLLVGDGKPVGGNVERLRATPEFIAALPEKLAQIVADAQTAAADILSALKSESHARTEADQNFQAALESETKERTEVDEYLQWQINTLQNLSALPEGATLTEVVNSISADKQDKITAAGSDNILTAPAEPGGQPGTIHKNLIANKKAVTPPAQTGTLDAVEQSQLIQSLVFDTQSEPDQSPEGFGYLLLSDGTKLDWDGDLFTLLDAGDNIIETIYNPLEIVKWAIVNHNFDEEKSITEIAVEDRTLGPWPHVTYSYQAPDTYIDLPEHLDNQQNPHNVTAEQTGAYTKSGTNSKIKELRDELDAKHGAIINLGYTKGYWYGRREAATPWPLPADGEIWAAHARKAFDFETSTVWEWDGEEWVEGAQIPTVNGVTIGISESFLDIVDSGLPGKAIFSAQTASWDFYPDKLAIEAIYRAIVPPGRPEYSSIRDEAVLAKFHLIPEDGRTISVHDSRVERILQYCLIPHEEAMANQNIIGYYLTHDHYPDHAAWLAAGKLRPDPAEDGAYIVIADGCGLYRRGAGRHGGHRPSVDAFYEGGNIASFQGFGGMGPPDYANIESINRISTNSGTWTVDRDGYIRVKMTNIAPLANTLYAMYASVNGVEVLNTSSAQNNVLTGIIPVKKWDIVSIVANGPSVTLGCYYIPPRCNVGNIYSNACITC